MNIALWIIQVVLAMMFAMTGFMKLAMPIADLAAQMPWAGAVPVWMVRMPGIAELFGAVGLLLPSLFRIKPRLTGFAAIGLMVVMLLGAGLHASRGEFMMVGPTIILALLSGFVAWGRLMGRPIEPKE